MHNLVETKKQKHEKLAREAQTEITNQQSNTTDPCTRRHRTNPRAERTISSSQSDPLLWSQVSTWMTTTVTLRPLCQGAVGERRGAGCNTSSQVNPDLSTRPFSFSPVCRHRLPKQCKHASCVIYEPTRLNATIALFHDSHTAYFNSELEFLMHKSSPIANKGRVTSSCSRCLSFPDRATGFSLNSK